MKNILKLVIGLSAAGALGMAQAAEVTLNPGDNAVVYTFDSLSVDSNGNITITGAEYQGGEFPYGGLQCGANTVQQGGECVGIGGGTSSSSSLSSSSASSLSSSSASSVSSSSSTSTSGNCPAPASNVVVEQNMFGWDTATSQLHMYLSRANIHAYPVQTTSRPAFNGQLSIVPFSNTGTVHKEVWISVCPGGPALREASCTRSGLQPSLYWEQNNASSRCSLAPNTTYYINVKNSTGACSTSSGCAAKIQHLISGSPY